MIDAVVMRAVDISSSLRSQEVSNILWSCAVLRCRCSEHLFQLLSRNMVLLPASAYTFVHQVASSVSEAWVSRASVAE
jgi:hypothetical protein